MAVLNNHHESLAWLDEKSRYDAEQYFCVSICVAALCFFFNTVFVAVPLFFPLGRQMHREIALVKKEMSYRTAY